MRGAFHQPSGQGMMPGGNNGSKNLTFAGIVIIFGNK
jgi:hypothetical protein